MKANELESKDLMIGDIVYACIEEEILGEAKYKIISKIKVLEANGDYAVEFVGEFPDELDWQDGDDISWVEPIPLSTDILLTNGFEQQELGGERVAIWTGFGEDNCHDIEVEFDGDKPIHLKIDGPVYLATPNIKYLHQLQHFLRDCETGKEIKL